MTSAATWRSKPGTPIETQAQDQNIWWKTATPRAVPKRSGSSSGKWFFTGAPHVGGNRPVADTGFLHPGSVRLVTLGRPRVQRHWRRAIPDPVGGRYRT